MAKQKPKDSPFKSAPARISVSHDIRNLNQNRDTYVEMAQDYTRQSLLAPWFRTYAAGWSPIDREQMDLVAGHLVDGGHLRQGKEPQWTA
ncbi:hypothetical protein GGG16DRAFT_114088, partial [Schizophyllum commune]